MKMTKYFILHVGVSFGKTPQNSSLVLVKPGKDRAVSEKLLKAALNTIINSIDLVLQLDRVLVSCGNMKFLS